MSENQNNKPTSSEVSPAQQKSEVFGPCIFTYSRKMALADGVQVDVSEMAREAGFKFPVFLTEAVHQKYVQVPEGVEGQDEKGRLWDILWMLRYAIIKAPRHATRVVFQLYVRNTNGEPRKVTLVVEGGAMDYDDPAPCLTVMLPNEDQQTRLPGPSRNGGAFLFAISEIRESRCVLSFMRLQGNRLIANRFFTATYAQLRNYPTKCVCLRIFESQTAIPYCNAILSVETLLR